MTKHAEELAKLGWQYFECPACGSEGARAFPKPEQEPVLQDIEQYRLQMAGISTAAIGYWKEGDGIHPDYDTLALRDVAKLYEKYDELYKAQDVSHGIIAGALFDFMGWLTSRPKRIMLSSADDASPAVDAIKDFAKMRGLSLDDARVQDWQEALAEQPAQQDSTCNNALRIQGKAYPRTCKKCGLGPCVELAQQALDKKTENAKELGLDYEPVQDGGIVTAGGFDPRTRRTWVGLTKDDATQIQRNMVYQNQPFSKVIEAIEAKLRSKNEDRN